ncbi:MAG: PqqD family peptide modification chaperone [Coriobacteriales bacterium]|jgi:hypothetical protein|nr:PqqD family peptide modification chaperone [Coriobacteriales bacterium]
MDGYQLCEGLRLQRNAKVADQGSVLTAVREGMARQDFNAEGAFLSLAREGRFHILNLSASLILEGLLEGRTDEALADVFEEVFQVDREQASRDIERVKRELIEKGFVERV